jgi:hypothetical protein
MTATYDPGGGRATALSLRTHRPTGCFTFRARLDSTEGLFLLPGAATNLRAVNLNCSNCGRNVPEGAMSCPSCKAGIGTVVFGRKKSLTRTLIGKAVELRTQIPWASASAVILIEDTKGNKRVRPLGLVILTVLVAGIVGGCYFGVRWLQTRSTPGPRVTAITSSDTDISSQAEEPQAKGTLAVNATHQGKTVAAKVRVNGDLKGTTPLRTSLPPGKYTLKIERAGLRTEKRVNVEVVSGRTSSLRVDLNK